MIIEDIVLCEKTFRYNCISRVYIEWTGNYIGGILGRQYFGTKTWYGKHSIINCYWSEEFLNILNNYVENYNQCDKELSDSKELLIWKIDSETGFPILNYSDSNE